MGGAGDQPLADADQLRAPAGVDAPGARAVLARDLTHPRVDAQPAERGGEHLGHLPEALRRAGRRAGVGDRPRAGQRLLVKHGGTATGEAKHGLEPALTSRAHGGGEARGRPILAREREDRPGAVEAKRSADSSPAATRIRMARETAVPKAGRPGKPWRATHRDGRAIWRKCCVGDRRSHALPAEPLASAGVCGTHRGGWPSRRSPPTAPSRSSVLAPREAKGSRPLF